MHKIIFLMSLAVAAVATKYTGSKNFTDAVRRLGSPEAPPDHSSLKKHNTIQNTVHEHFQNQNMYKESIADIDHVCLANLNVGAKSENVYDSPLIDSSITISNGIFPMNLFADSEIYNTPAKSLPIPAVNDRAKKVVSKIAIDNEHFLSKRDLHSVQDSSKDATTTACQSDTDILHSSIEELEPVFHKKVESEVISHSLPADSSYSDPSIIKSIHSAFDLSLASIGVSSSHIALSSSDNSYSKNITNSGKDTTITNNIETSFDEKRELSSLIAVISDDTSSSPVALQCFFNDTGSQSLLLEDTGTQTIEDYSDDSNSPGAVVKDLENDAVVMHTLSPSSTNASNDIAGIPSTSGSSQDAPLTPNCSSTEIIESPIPVAADINSENNIEILTQLTSTTFSDLNKIEASKSVDDQITATNEPVPSLSNDEHSHGKSNLTIHIVKVKSSPQSDSNSYDNIVLQPDRVSLESHSYYGRNPYYYPDHKSHSHSSPRTMRHSNVASAAQTSDQNNGSFGVFSVQQAHGGYSDSPLSQIKSQFSRQHMLHLPAEGVSRPATRYSDTYRSYNSDYNVRKPYGIVHSENILNQRPSNMFDGHSADVSIYNRGNYKNGVSMSQHSNSFGGYGSVLNQNNVFDTSGDSGYMAYKVPKAPNFYSGSPSKSTFKDYPDRHSSSPSGLRPEWHSRVSSTSLSSKQQHASSTGGQIFSIADNLNYPLHTYLGENLPVSRPSRSHNTAELTYSQRFSTGGNYIGRGFEQSGVSKSIPNLSSYGSQDAYGSSGSSALFPRKELGDTSYSLGKKLKTYLESSRPFSVGDIKGFHIPGISATGSESTAGYSSVYNVPPLHNALGVSAGLRTPQLYHTNYGGSSERFSGQHYVNSPGIHRTDTTHFEGFSRPSSFEYVGSGISAPHTQFSNSQSGVSGNYVHLASNLYKHSSVSSAIQSPTFHVSDLNKTLQPSSVNTPSSNILQSSYGLQSNVANVRAITAKENPTSSQYAATNQKSEEEVENEQDNESGER